jgi:rubrerythrin
MSRRYTREELDELERRDELYVCPSCDAHMHVDDIGQVCPYCFISADDLRGDQ